MARYKKIGKDKWLRIQPTYLEPWYFEKEEDDKDRPVCDNYMPYDFNEIVISRTDPSDGG